MADANTVLLTRYRVLRHLRFHPSVARIARPSRNSSEGQEAAQVGRHWKEQRVRLRRFE